MTWLLNHPLALWASFLAVTGAIGLVASAVWPDVVAGPAGVSGLQLLLVTILALITLPFAARVGWQAVGLRLPRRNSVLLLAFPAATVAYGYLAGFNGLPVDQIALAVALVAVVGIGEELAFRGVLLRALAPRGLWRAVLISSACFGLMHTVNLLLGAPLPGTLLQIVFAGLGGVGFAAMRIVSGSLLPGMALHALYDLTFRVGLVEPGTMFANSVFMLHGVGWLVWALVVLRRSGTSRDADEPQLAPA